MSEKSKEPKANIAVSSSYLTALIHPDPTGQNGHHFVGPPGGQRFAPVVRFGVIEPMEQSDGITNTREAAKQRVVDSFILVLGQHRVDGRQVTCALGLILEHGSGLLFWIVPPWRCRTAWAKGG